MLLSKSSESESYQKFFIGSSTINQSSSKEHQSSDKYHIKNFNDLQRLHANLRSVINGSSKNHQRIIDEAAMKHQWFRV